eukprot:m.41701 g.41701  ORF g.41701 m.41701 type:complete len:833 (+) comp5686_c0_seq2:61-2559(+)
METPSLAVHRDSFLDLFPSPFNPFKEASERPEPRSRSVSIVISRQSSSLNPFEQLLSPTSSGNPFFETPNEPDETSTDPPEVDNVPTQESDSEEDDTSYSTPKSAFKFAPDELAEERRKREEAEEKVRELQETLDRVREEKFNQSLQLKLTLDDLADAQTSSRGIDDDVQELLQENEDLEAALTGAKAEVTELRRLLQAARAEADQIPGLRAEIATLKAALETAHTTHTPSKAKSASRKASVDRIELHEKDPSPSKSPFKRGSSGSSKETKEAAKEAAKTHARETAKPHAKETKETKHATSTVQSPSPQTPSQLTSPDQHAALGKHASPVLHSQQPAVQHAPQHAPQPAVQHAPQPAVQHAPQPAAQQHVQQHTPEAVQQHAPPHAQQHTLQQPVQQHSPHVESPKAASPAPEAVEPEAKPPLPVLKSSPILSLRGTPSQDARASPSFLFKAPQQEGKPSPLIAHKDISITRTDTSSPALAQKDTPIARADNPSPLVAHKEAPAPRVDLPAPSWNSRGEISPSMARAKFMSLVAPNPSTSGPPSPGQSRSIVAPPPTHTPTAAAHAHAVTPSAAPVSTPTSVASAPASAPSSAAARAPAPAAAPAAASSAASAQSFSFRRTATISSRPEPRALIPEENPVPGRNSMFARQTSVHARIAELTPASSSSDAPVRRPVSLTSPTAEPPQAHVRPTSLAPASSPTEPSKPANEAVSTFDRGRTMSMPVKRHPAAASAPLTSTTTSTNPNQCLVCHKTVYLVEKLEADGKLFHKNCFRCTECGKAVSLGSYAALEGKVFCKPHFKQLFKLKGNYNEGFGTVPHKYKWDHTKGGEQEC